MGFLSEDRQYDETLNNEEILELKILNFEK